VLKHLHSLFDRSRRALIDCFTEEHFAILRDLLSVPAFQIPTLELFQAILATSYDCVLLAAERGLFEMLIGLIPLTGPDEQRAVLRLFETGVSLASEDVAQILTPAFVDCVAPLCDGELATSVIRVFNRLDRQTLTPELIDLLAEPAFAMARSNNIDVMLNALWLIRQFAYRGYDAHDVFDTQCRDGDFLAYLRDRFSHEFDRVVIESLSVVEAWSDYEGDALVQIIDLGIVLATKELLSRTLTIQEAVLQFWITMASYVDGDAAGLFVEQIADADFAALCDPDKPFSLRQLVVDVVTWIAVLPCSEQALEQFFSPEVVAAVIEVADSCGDTKKLATARRLSTLIIKIAANSELVQMIMGLWEDCPGCMEVWPDLDDPPG
jgi:hypothetical protein